MKSQIEFIDAFNRFGLEYCSRFSDGYVRCKKMHRCSICEIADRIRRNAMDKHIHEPLFSWSDALPCTPSGGGENWYQKPVILAPESLERLRIDKLLVNQIIIAYDGPGVFRRNEAGAIDGYLLCDKQKHVTVNRKECYGIPTLRAAMRYDDLFFLGLYDLLKIEKVKRGGELI